MTRFSIGPETRVADLLDAHPEAEEILIAIAPQFKALKNPVLRRTVAQSGHPRTGRKGRWICRSASWS